LHACRSTLEDPRFQQVMDKLTATGRPRVVRRDIARIKTILRERELGIEVQETGR
jgi:LSU ribosomal protein L29P